MARRDRAVSNKIAKLAGSPCSYEPAAVHFSLNNSNSVEDNTTRDRTLGMNNRVLAGLMLHTWRSQDEQCAQSRYTIGGAGAAVQHFQCNSSLHDIMH
jgi:hypothetical protein